MVNHGINLWGSNKKLLNYQKSLSQIDSKEIKDTKKIKNVDSNKNKNINSNKNIDDIKIRDTIIEELELKIKKLNKESNALKREISKKM